MKTAPSLIFSVYSDGVINTPFSSDVGTVDTNWGQVSSIPQDCFEYVIGVGHFVESDILRGT